jgi:hypothetical protein
MYGTRSSRSKTRRGGRDAGVRNPSAGHMMYIHSGELAKLRKDVGTFLKAALPAM